MHQPLEYEYSGLQYDELDQRWHVKLPYVRLSLDFIVQDIYVGFYEGHLSQSQDVFKRLFNQMVYYVVGGVTHSEFCLKLVNRHHNVVAYLSYVIFMNGKLYCRLKTQIYKNELWELYRLNLSPMEQREVVQILQDDTRRGVYYSNAIFFNILFCGLIKIDRQCVNHAFCSEHIAYVLKKAGVPGFENIDPCMMTPPKLKNLIMTSSLFADKEPLKLVNKNEDGTG